MAFVALHNDDNFYSLFCSALNDDAWMKNTHVMNTAGQNALKAIAAERRLPAQKPPPYEGPNLFPASNLSSNLLSPPSSLPPLLPNHHGLLFSPLPCHRPSPRARPIADPQLASGIPDKRVHPIRAS